MSDAGGYSDAVARRFEAPAGAGRPDGPGWVSGEAREPLTATHVRCHLRAEHGRVSAVRFEVRGCPHTIAAVSLAAEQLSGRPVAGLGLDLQALAAALDVPAPKLGRLFVIQDAIHTAALLLGASTA